MADSLPICILIFQKMDLHLLLLVHLLLPFLLVLGPVLLGIK
jgi:hypothetical protein